MAVIKSLSKPERTAKTALQSLSSAAMALPAFASAPPADVSVDYHYFQYREADLAADKTTGSRSRYEVDGHKLRAAMPWRDNWAISGDLTVESMSGASPWFVTPGSNGLPVQVMSGASIADNREDLNASLSHYGKQLVSQFTLGHSNEDDYQANYAAVHFQFEPTKQQYAFSFGLNYSDDKLEPTEGASTRFPDRIAQADKSQFGVQAGFTQILAKDTIVQVGASYQRNEGFLSDPYKLVFVGSSVQADTRPDQRTAGAWFVRWRRHFKALKAALHLDYRGTRDDWDVQSTTVETQWVQRFAEQWRVSAGVRYYSQSQAGFYAPFFASEPQDGYKTSDYRLSPYGAISLLLQVNATWDAWDVAAGIERYDSSADYALDSVELENPGLVDFQMLNLRVAYRF